MLSALLLSACLIDTDLYNQRLEELTGGSDTASPVDADQDGWTVPADCDDTNAAVHPDATEVCNDIDDDCSGVADDDAVDAPTWFIDGDGDGYGVPDSTTRACTQPDGYSAVNTDCDDVRGSVHPGADEIPYDGIDQDCLDGDLDDLDNDGAGIATDCDDNDPDRHPGAAETWANGATDNNCDGDYGAATLEYGAEVWTGEAAGDNAGRRVAAHDDVDGDGLAEFLVAAPFQSSDFERGGAVYLVHGADPGPLGAEGVVRPHDEYLALGSAMAGGFDMTGDGVADVLLSATLDDDGAGAVWLLDGTALPGEGEEATVLESNVWAATGNAAADYAGSSVAFLGDVTGDGVGDIGVGAPFADVGGMSDAGRVGIWSGVDTSGTVSDADIVVEGFYATAGAGGRVANAGDQDGDGIDDYMVGFADGVIAMVMPGGPDGASMEDGFIFSVAEETSVDVRDPHMVGDVDGDGFPDLVVIEENLRVLVYTLLRANRVQSNMNAANVVTIDEDSYIFSATDLGDIDDDGTSDTLIAANYYAPAGTAVAALVFGPDLSGTDDFDFADATLHAESLRSYAGFGYRAALSPDIDGDGQADIIMGGAGDAEAGKNSGSATLLRVPD